MLDVDPHSQLSLGAAPGDCPPGDPPPELPLCPASKGRSTDKLIAQHSRHDFNRTGQADGRGVTEERQRSSVRWQNNKQAEAQNSSQGRAVCRLCEEGTQVLGRLPSCS